jgi:hypothetical protein
MKTYRRMQQPFRVTTNQGRNHEPSTPCDKRWEYHSVRQKSVLEINDREDKQNPEEQGIDDRLEMHAELPNRQDEQHERSELNQGIPERHAGTAMFATFPQCPTGNRHRLPERTRRTALTAAVPTLEGWLPFWDLADRSDGKCSAEETDHCGDQQQSGHRPTSALTQGQGARRTGRCEIRPAR